MNKCPNTSINGVRLAQVALQVWSQYAPLKDSSFVLIYQNAKILQDSKEFQDSKKRLQMFRKAISEAS